MKVFGALNARLALLNGTFKFSNWDSFELNPFCKLKQKNGSTIIINGKFSFGYVVGGTVRMPHCKHGNICLGPDSKFTINGSVQIEPGCFIYLQKNASFEIGNNTFIYTNCNILIKNKITIGNDCAISWGVNILDSDFHEIVNSKNIIVNNLREDGIEIGNHVLIMQGATILKGVKIGDNAVIGSNAVVRKNVKTGTVVAGNPARMVMKSINWKL